MDPEAQQKFQELLDMLKGQMAQKHGPANARQMEGMTPEQMAAMSEMMRQLNQMMRDKLEGPGTQLRPVHAAVRPHVGDNPPQSFEELMEQLQQQLSQMQSLMDSMSPEMRRGIGRLAHVCPVAGDARADGPVRLPHGTAYANGPDAPAVPFPGRRQPDYEQAMEMMRNMQDLDQLEQALQEAMRTGQLGDVDPEKLAELLGEEGPPRLGRNRPAPQDAGGSGLHHRQRQGGVDRSRHRRIGQKALNEVFAHIKKDRIGDHDIEIRGNNGDWLGETKTYEFGDPFQIDLQTTVKKRRAPRWAGTPGQDAPRGLRDLPHRGT